jgi:hypothetical protein
MNEKGNITDKELSFINKNWEGGFLPVILGYLSKAREQNLPIWEVYAIEIGQEDQTEHFPTVMAARDFLLKHRRRFKLDAKIPSRRQN